MYLATAWRDGAPPTVAAAALRSRPGGDFSPVLGLCDRILRAYAHLHAQGVIHADVHPRNILVADDGSVTLLDFGAARFASGGLAPRGRVGAQGFFEPEVAAARLRKHRGAPSDLRRGTVRLGALVYLLVTGHPYLDWSADKEGAYAQVVRDPPLPFAARATRPFPVAEAAIRRAPRKTQGGGSGRWRSSPT